MRKSFVCLGHFMNFSFFLDRRSFLFVSCHYFGSKFLSHRLFISFTRKFYHPGHSHRDFTLRSDFHWYLKCSTTDSSASNLNLWHNIRKCFFPHIEAVFFKIIFFNNPNCVIKNFKSKIFLPLIIIVLTNLVTNLSPNFGSGNNILFLALDFLTILKFNYYFFFGFFCTILRSSLISSFYTRSIKCTTNYMISYAR